MTQLRYEAQRLAAAGRYGDSELVHMSPDEVDVLDSTGLLSTNPETGLPEAFGLGDLFKGIGSIGAGIVGTALGGPFGAALASGIFTGLTEKNLKKGLLSGMLGFAGGKALQSAVKAGAPGATDVVQVGSDLAGDNPDIFMPAAVGQNLTRGDRIKSFVGAIPDAFGSEAGRGAAASALTEGRMPFMLYPQIGNVLQSIDQDSGGSDTWDEDVARYREQYNRYAPAQSMYGQRIQNRYRGGGHVGYGMTKNKWGGGGLVHTGIGAYAGGGKVHRYNEGGSVSPEGYQYDWEKQDGESLGDYMDRIKRQKKEMRMAKERQSSAQAWAAETFGPTQSNAPPPGYIPGYMPEFSYITPQGVTPDNPAEWAQPMGANPFDMGGISPILDQGRDRFLMELSQGAYPGSPPPPRSDPGGVVDPGITQMRPRQPQGPTFEFDPSVFTGGGGGGGGGDDRDLAMPRSFAGGGMIDGPGMGGMADSVPAMISDSGEPALLSEGEFVVPADVVSMLGDGDSNSGARVLEQMIAQVRMAKTGNPDQAPPLDPSMMGAM